MTYPTAGGGLNGDKFGDVVKVNDDYMGVLTKNTNGFHTFGSFQDNPSLHLYKRQEDDTWAVLGAPFYLYPFYDNTQRQDWSTIDENWQIINFGIVKENLFLITCKEGTDYCTLRHFYNDGTSWQLILADDGSGFGYSENYIYPGVDDMDQLSMFGYGDYLTVGCGSTSTPVDLDCYSMKLWKKDPTNLEFTLHQTISAPGEWDELLGVQDMSPDGQWLVTYGNPGNDVFKNVGGTWSYHSRIPDLRAITIDNGRLVGADRTTDTLETYVLESNVWTKKPLMTLVAGMDVTSYSSPEFKLSVDKLYFMDKTTSTIKIYEAGANIWTQIQDISQIGSFQSSDFVSSSSSKLRRFSATEFAITAPFYDNNKGMVLFMEDGTAYPTVSPTGAPTASPSASPTETGETPGPTASPTTNSPSSSPVASTPVECADDGVSSSVVAGAAAGAGLGGALLGAGITYFFVAARSGAPVVVAGPTAYF